MRHSSTSNSPQRPLSWILFSALLSFAPALVLGSTGAGSFSSPWTIAGVMIGSGLLCTVAAGIALRASLQVGFVENALVAGGLVASGLFVLLHGLVSPGALVNDRMREFAASGQLSAVVAIPALLYLVLAARRVERSAFWRLLSVGTPIMAVGLALLLLGYEGLIPLKPRTSEAVVLVGASLSVHLTAAIHFGRLAQRFGDRYSQHLGIGLVLSAGVPIFFYFGGPGSGAYWWAHGLCMAGVAVGSVAIWRKAHEASVATQLVGSILTSKPVRSLDVELSPSVIAHLKEIRDPTDPRLTVAIRASEKLAELKQDRKIEADVLIPIFHTTIESMSSSYARS